jgi:hypothetical protein
MVARLMREATSNSAEIIETIVKIARGPDESHAEARV